MSIIEYQFSNIPKRMLILSLDSLVLMFVTNAYKNIGQIFMHRYCIIILVNRSNDEENTQYSRFFFIFVMVLILSVDLF